MNRVVTTKAYFVIWLVTLVIFIIQTAALNIFSKILLSQSILSTIFFYIYLINIIAGTVTFIFGLVSLVTKNESIQNPDFQEKKILPKDKPKNFLLVLSFVFFIASIIFLFISNNPSFTSDTNQFLRLTLLSLISIISLVLFIAYINSYPNKIIKKNLVNKERRTFTYWVGNLIISGLLALFLSIIFFFIMMPFMQVADGLSFEEKAKIGEVNMWRVVVMYGLLTGLITYLTFSKKIYRTLAVILIFFWIFGSGLTAFITIIDKNAVLNSPNKNDFKPVSEDFITTRDSCNLQKSLQMAKKCVLRILRDDGGHGTGFVIKPGYLITNKHVIEGASKLTVYIDGEREVKVWNYSPNLDLAVLKLPESSLTNSCNWFDSNQLNIAEELYVFGWPNDPKGDSTVTRGIYSRTNKYVDGTEDIQTDAPVNPGNSGGPLVNECGVVGIITTRAEWSEEQSPRVIEGMSFALSSNFVHKKIDDLIKTGNLAKGIPNQTRYQSRGGPFNDIPQNYTLNIDEIQSYLNDLYRVKSSWEQARGHVDGEKLEKLIDLFNRQIDFCTHLVNKLSGGQKASGDDVNLWKAVIRMSRESAALTNELNQR